MIIDKELVFSDAQAITTAGSLDSTNILDHVKGGGPYDNVWLFAKSDTAFTGLTSMVIELHTSNDNFSSDDVVLYKSGTILLADLTANTVQVKVRLPLGVKRYLKVVYTTVGTEATGTMDAMLVPDVNEEF